MNIKKICISVSLILFSFWLSACTIAPKFSVTDSDNQKHYTLKKGDIFIIALEAQLSTGYGWQVSSISGAEQYGKITVETDQSGIMGGRDIQKIGFKAILAGNGFIELKYVQPWKLNDTPLKYYKIYLTIE